MRTGPVAARLLQLRPARRRPGCGREVVTTGYGDLQGGTDARRHYTARVSGTSSASPVVLGALAAVQGIHHGRGPLRLTPARTRALLRMTGSPQQDAPSRPASQRIGRLPDTRQLLAAAQRLSVRTGDTGGDGRAEMLVTSPWGIGILEQSGSTLANPVIAPKGTRFGGWLLNTADNQIGPLADLDGGGHAEVLVTSPWGIGVLEQSGSTLANPCWPRTARASSAGCLTPPTTASSRSATSTATDAPRSW